VDKCTISVIKRVLLIGSWFCGNLF